MILVTSMKNDGLQAKLLHTQNKSVELEEAKKFELKLKSLQAEMDELLEKKTVCYAVISTKLLCCHAKHVVADNGKRRIEIK